MAAKHCKVTAEKIATEMNGGGGKDLGKWKICISRDGHTPFSSPGQRFLPCSFSHYPECRDFRASWIVIKISSKTAAEIQAKRIRTSFSHFRCRVENLPLPSFLLSVGKEKIPIKGGCARRT